MSLVGRFVGLVAPIDVGMLLKDAHDLFPTAFVPVRTRRERHQHFGKLVCLLGGLVFQFGQYFLSLDEHFS